MIVKNESHVIAKTLGNILDHIPISFYVISDTGSTDNTEQIIKDFFTQRNIPGQVTNDPWQDFATNRSIAIRHAQDLSPSDYLFIFDADDSIHGTVPPIFQSKLYDSYQFTFGDNVTYTRPLLIRATLPWRFRCVLHEFLHLDQQHS
jgi:glycosyltransferase involved in cell wall biosynthesis